MLPWKYGIIDTWHQHPVNPVSDVTGKQPKNKIIDTAPLYAHLFNSTVVPKLRNWPGRGFISQLKLPMWIVHDIVLNIPALHFLKHWEYKRICWCILSTQFQAIACCLTKQSHSFNHYEHIVSCACNDTFSYFALKWIVFIPENLKSWPLIRVSVS